MKVIFTTFIAISLIAGNVYAQQAGLTEADHLQIAVQKICPVTGEALGTMGEPIKVQVGEQIAYLCCAGCQSKQIAAEHWQTIQANMAAAQGTCPIMEKPVTADMKSTVVNGQQVFVCCPPCIAKIQADPTTSLDNVNASYATYVKAEALAHSEHMQMMAQGICPVTGEKLGSMGVPIKVQAGEETLFLCCKGCVGKEINAEHWATIQTSQATAQGVCPVMDEAIDASMESTIVNGRKIFVCCPPCIKKIQADPASYVAKLDQQIAKNASGEGDSDAHSHSHDGPDHSDHNHK